MRLSRYVLEIEPQLAESHAQDFVSCCPINEIGFTLSRKEFHGIEIVPYKIMGLMESYVRMVERIMIVK
jgi:hypothetical protein